MQSILFWSCFIPVGQSLPAHLIKRFPQTFFFVSYVKTIFSLLNKDTYCSVMHAWSFWTGSVVYKTDTGCIASLYFSFISSSSVLFLALREREISKALKCFVYPCSFYKMYFEIFGTNHGILVNLLPCTCHGVVMLQTAIHFLWSCTGMRLFYTRSD